MKSYYTRIFIICFLFVSLISRFYLIGNQNVGDILNVIPKDEKEALNKLFHNLFNRNNFSYTLFGDKPMSLAAYLTSSFDDEGMPSDIELSFWNEWAVWKKYEKAFPMKHYLLIEGPTRGRSKEIYFINRKCFTEKVDEYCSLFQKAFGENITGSLLLKRIEENHKFLSFLSNHQTLLGILLGYGKHNASLFDKRNQISPFVYKKEFPKIPVKVPTPSKNFSSLQEEFNSYFSVLTLFGDPGYSPLMIHSVHFVADHKHPETIALKEKYRRLRGEISAIYAKGNFLEITLSKLTEK